MRLLEAFREKHKADPVYVRLAETRIDELKRQQEAAQQTDNAAKTKADGDAARLAAAERLRLPTPRQSGQRPVDPGVHHTLDATYFASLIQLNVVSSSTYIYF